MIVLLKENDIARHLKIDLPAKEPARRCRRNGWVEPNLIPNVVFIGYLLRLALFGGLDLLVLGPFSIFLLTFWSVVNIGNFLFRDKFPRHDLKGRAIGELKQHILRVHIRSRTQI